MTSSKAYLEALIQRDQKLILQIYAESFPSVRKFIEKNRGNLQDSEDVFQKGLLQIAVKYQNEAFEIKSSFHGYLFVVCKNLWIREMNKPKSSVLNPGIVNQLSEPDDQVQAVVEQKRQELFEEKLGLISENCKKILELYFSRVPSAEIKDRMFYNSESVVRQRIHKCKKKLTDLIKADRRYKSLKEI